MALIGPPLGGQTGPLGEQASPLRGAPSYLPHHHLLVCLQDEATIAVLDMESLEVLGSIRLEELGFSGGAMPHHIAVLPDGTGWFVSLIGENRILHFDATHRLVRSWETPTPGMLALTPDGATLVASRSMGAVNPPRAISLLRLDPLAPGAGTLEELEVIFPRPHAILTDVGGAYAYTASLGLNQVAVVDLHTERVALLDVPGETHALVQFDRSPDGSLLVAGGELSGSLLVFSLEDPAAPSLLRSIPLGDQPFDPRFSPDGRTLWVPLKGSDEVVVLDTADWEVLARVTDPDIRQPHALVFSPDGERVFLSNNAKDPHAMHHPGGGGGEVGSLVVVDTRTLSITATLPLGRNLTGMAARPPIGPP